MAKKIRDDVDKIKKEVEADLKKASDEEISL